MQKVICILGPTGTGKTALSVKLAKYLNTEIISGDSIQVYRSLDIGSAKITKEEMDGVKHHLIDILDPNDSYSVSDFQKSSREIMDDLFKENKIPIICGGTGFYIKAALFNYEFNENKRTEEYSFLTNEELYAKLQELNDPEIPDINNRKRLLRHLEIMNSGTQTYKKDEPLYDYLLIGLTLDRELMYERINKRVDKMIEDGLVEEVKNLYDNNVNSISVSAIGYKELYKYFNNECPLDESIALIKQHTRNFAKRQITWFNNQMNVNWINIINEDPYQKSIELINEFLKKWEN